MVVSVVCGQVVTTTATSPRAPKTWRHLQTKQNVRKCTAHLRDRGEQKLWHSHSELVWGSNLVWHLSHVLVPHAKLKPILKPTDIAELPDHNHEYVLDWKIMIKIHTSIPRYHFFASASRCRGRISPRPLHQHFPIGFTRLSCLCAHTYHQSSAIPILKINDAFKLFKVLLIISTAGSLVMRAIRETAFAKPTSTLPKEKSRFDHTTRLHVQTHPPNNATMDSAKSVESEPGEYSELVFGCVSGMIGVRHLAYAAL